MDKQNLRRDALIRRDHMAHEERFALSQSLELYYKHLPSAKNVAGFWPIRSEIDPRPLMFALQKQGAQLALPDISGDDSADEGAMVFRAFLPEDELIEMGFKTLGPAKTAKLITPDLIFMPLAVFDEAGNRIGYGGGYYDRALAKMKLQGIKPQLIGLAFDCQKVETIPYEPHDIAMDAILTESGLHYFNQSA